MSKENKEYNLEELLRKSPMDVTHDEMMYVLENMNMEALVQAAAEKHNLQSKKSSEENQ